MKEIQERPRAILWVEASGFSFMIMMSWLTEWFRIPHYLFGETFAPDWHRAMLRTGVLLLIWAWVHFVTSRLLKRLHHLEEYLRICGWCRKVCHEDEWMEMEKFFKSKFSTKTSHGMCPECLEKKRVELTPAETPAGNPRTPAN